MKRDERQRIQVLQEEFVQIGVELNEPPIVMGNDLSRMEEGSVVALDIHMPDRSIGVVKLEDMILVRHSCNEVLNVTPRDLFEVPLQD